MPKRITFMNVPMNVATRRELLDAIEGTELVRIATPNPEFMLDAEKDSVFREALSKMTHCAIDGSGLYFALRFLRREKVEQVHGSDLVAQLFDIYSNGEKRFFLLGSADAPAVLPEIRRRYPNLIVDALDAGKLPVHPKANPEVIHQIVEHKTDILLVGFGAPRQEIWMTEAWDARIPVMVGVGGTFNFYGNKKRAPRLISKLHLEWLYRSFFERGHAKRAFRATVVFTLKALLSR